MLSKDKERLAIANEKKKKLETVQEVHKDKKDEEILTDADWILAKGAAKILELSVKRLDAYRMIVKNKEDRAIKKGYYLMTFKKIGGRIYYQRESVLKYKEFRARKRKEREEIKRNWRGTVTFESL